MYIYIYISHRAVTNNGLFLIYRWADGYSKRFGLHYVDFNSRNKDRYVKQSATWMKAYMGAHQDTYKGRPYL
ncbi:glycosyl hydrolase family protein, partial [archaeon]